MKSKSARKSKPRRAPKTARDRIVEATGSTYMDRFGYAPIGVAVAHVLGAVLQHPLTVPEVRDATKEAWFVGIPAVYAAVLRAELAGLVRREVDSKTLRWAYSITTEGRAAYYAHKAALREWVRLT